MSDIEMVVYFMLVYAFADPNHDCRFCNHALRESKNGISVDSVTELYCPVKKCHVDYEMATQCGTECEDRDINKNWVDIDRALKIGREYARTGDRRVFTRGFTNE